jgi:ADP-heptose:LPS heptosyltransferase
VLVLRPGALGDTLLAVPALRALRRAGSSVTLAAHAATARLLELLGEVDRGISFEDPSLRWLFTGGIVPEEPVVAWMAPAPGLGRASVLAPSRPPTMDRHCARYLLKTLAPLGIHLTWDDSPLRVAPLASNEVLVHPGSGSRAKNWPPEHFAALIRAVDGPVRLVVGEADVRAADDVDAHVGRALPRLELPTLEELAARLAGCKAYVGNDSGVSHLAGLCGARTIVLFGPSDPNVWRPIGPRVEVVPFDAEPSEVVSLLRRDS